MNPHESWDWFSSHHYIASIFDSIKFVLKTDPEAHVIFAQILQEVVSAWLQAVQRSGHLQSSLVRCDLNPSTLQLLGVDQWRFGRKLILYSGTLNSFVQLVFFFFFFFFLLVVVVVVVHHHPNQVDSMSNRYIFFSDGQSLSKCRSRDLDFLPIEPPSSSIFLGGLNACLTEFPHLPKTIGDL